MQVTSEVSTETMIDTLPTNCLCSGVRCSLWLAKPLTWIAYHAFARELIISRRPRAVSLVGKVCPLSKKSLNLYAIVAANQVSVAAEITVLTWIVSTIFLVLFDSWGYEFV